jgi:hypothetical protein
MDIYSLLKDPWITTQGQTILNLNNELKQEMVQEHPLYGKPLNAIARSEACDDVLYQDQVTQHYYLVHLTWAKQNSGKYPAFKAFLRLEDFIRYCEETFQFHEDDE